MKNILKKKILKSKQSLNQAQQHHCLYKKEEIQN